MNKTKKIFFLQIYLWASAFLFLCVCTETILILCLSIMVFLGVGDLPNPECQNQAQVTCWTNSRVEESHALSQPSCSIVLDFQMCVLNKRRNGVWKDRGVMKQGANTRSMLIIAGLLEEENTSRRIRSWWQAKEALDVRMSSWIDRMDVGVHVGITGFFYRASEYRIFFSESGMNTHM